MLHLTHIEVKGEIVTEVTKQYLNDKIKLTYLLIGIFLLVVTNITMDFIKDFNILEFFLRLTVQVGVLGLIGYTTHIVWLMFTKEHQEKQLIQKDLIQVKKEAKAWELKSKDFVKDYRNYIFSRFDGWNLSKSEKEIALLLLQGKSSKEMAEFRFTSERTIRNQCRSIYEKTNLGGKNEFMAYFLEGLIKD